MLTAHKVIDALLGKLSSPLSEVTRLMLTREQRVDLSVEIRLAEKFDFGPLCLERDCDYHGMAMAFLIPPMTADELAWWRDQLTPLPFHSVWYEFSMIDSIGAGQGALLITEFPGGWKLRRFAWGQGGLVHDGVVLRMNYYTTAEGNDYSLEGTYPLLVKASAENGRPLPKSEDEWVGDGYLAMYLNLMLNSKTTVREKVTVGERLRKPEQRKGRTPLADHTVVTIVPKSYRAASEAEVVGTHASPRLHWRRSHQRHYDHAVSSAQWAPEMEHNGVKGWWVTVIPRMLVGRADLGEVSHEYRVAHEEKADADIRLDA